MDDFALGLQRLLGTGAEHALDVGLVGFMAAKVDGGRKGFALQPARRHVDDQRIDRQPRHALGGVDRQSDGMFGAVEIDDHADFTPCDF